MFTVSVRDIDTIIQDFGIQGKCVSISELQRYHYEKNNPASKEVRLIVKVGLNNGRKIVIRFKNEKGVSVNTVNNQSCFSVLLANNKIETPKVYSSAGQYARQYQIGGYEVIVTVEDFVTGELREVDVETAEKTGELLARTHNIAEASDFHVKNDVLFDPLKRNDLFSFEDFTANKDYLMTVNEALYNDIIRERTRLFQRVYPLGDEPKYAVQGDISNCNLYRTASGDIGLFDFNRCGDNVLFFDAAMQAIFEARLMDYPEELAEKPEGVILPAFLKGYHRERPFTDEQKEAFPYLYALVSAFWLADMTLDEHSLTRTVEREDSDAALRWMIEIYNRITCLPKMLMFLS